MPAAPTEAPRDTELGEPESEVSAGAQLTYQAIAAYAFDEAVCWPSMDTIAGDRGCSERTIRRHVAELQRAGWLRISDKRGEWTDASGKVRRSKWKHNVYELLAPYGTSEPTMRKLVRRAHKKPIIAAFARASRGPCPTNTEGVLVGPLVGPWCGCRSCRPDRPTLARAPWTPVMDAIEAREELFERELTPEERRVVARSVTSAALVARMRPVHR